jgi:sec-independent protein translocase protein TatA
MGDLQPWHIIVLLVVLFLLFGAKRMPDMARSVGQSLRIFKSEMRQGAKETEEAAKATNDAVRPASAAVENSQKATAADAEKTHTAS